MFQFIVYWKFSKPYLFKRSNSNYKIIHEMFMKFWWNDESFSAWCAASWILDITSIDLRKLYSNKIRYRYITIYIQLCRSQLTLNLLDKWICKIMFGPLLKYEYFLFNYIISTCSTFCSISLSKKSLEKLKKNIFKSGTFWTSDWNLYI